MATLGNATSAKSLGVLGSAANKVTPVTSTTVVNNPNIARAQASNDAWDKLVGNPVGTTSAKQVSDDSIIGKVGNWLEDTVGKTAVESRDNIVQAVKKVADSVSNGSSGSGSSTTIQNPVDYLHADIAKHYGMNAETAYMEALSNTAHQREVQDLIKAGINPALAYTNSGATVNSVQSGNEAGGATDTGLTGKGLMKLAGTAISLILSKGNVRTALTTSRLFDNLFD